MNIEYLKCWLHLFAFCIKRK